MYLVGIADDLIGLKYRAKFVAQIIAASMMIVGGLELDDLHGFLFIHELPILASILMTILLTVFITNAINLIDGIDGLVMTSLVLTLTNYLLSEYIDITLLFCLDLLFWILANVALSRAIRRRSRYLGQVLYQ